jgi:hypothetical protein
MASMEVLEHAPLRQHHRRWPWVIAAVLAVFAFTAWQVNSWAEERLSDEVTASSDAALAAIERGESTVRATVAYASPQLQVGPPEVKAALEELVRSAVTQAQLSYTQARSQVADISIFPWQQEVKAEQRAALTKLDERARTITEATGQGLAYQHLQTSGTS